MHLKAFSWVLAATLGSALDAQTISRVVPDAASPGDLVIVQGSGLGAVASVRFRATVGGFAGSWTVDVTPLSLSATALTVRVPQMAGFAPPTAVPPGDPMGRISIGASGTRFFFLQGTFDPRTNLAPQSVTQGVGTTQSTGAGRPVVCFDLDGGAPVAGNAGFVFELENAVPASAATAVIGLPAPLPYLPIGDGTLTVGTAVMVFVGPIATDAAGDARLPLPVPGAPVSSVDIALQWAVLDAGLAGGVAVSNGLRITL